MIESVLSLARPAIRKMKAYSSARSLTTTGTVFLDANENPWGTYNRYPEPQPKKLLDTLATLYAVRPESVFIGRGTDDAIDTLVRTFCEASVDSILICPPTYGMYEVAANIQGASVARVPVMAKNEFQVDTEAILTACHPNVKLVFLCTPGNPTGNCIPLEQLESIAKGLEGRALLVVDEAYLEFSYRPSFTSKLALYPNVVVLRTLSKAWGLAGARCGVAIGHPEVIGLLHKVRAPYPISDPSQKAALDILSPEKREAFLTRTARLIQSREFLRQELSRLSFVKKIYPSEANFLLIKTTGADQVMKACKDRGIIIRDRRHDFGLENCIRISVGTEEENAFLLKTLGDIDGK